jgi:hypothetical protein
VGSALTSGGAAAAGGSAHPVLLAAVVGIAVIAAFGGVIALRYRDELLRALGPT